MKIAVVGTRGYPNIQGGVEVHCEQLYTHLAKRGCDVTVFARKPYMVSDIETYKGTRLIAIDCPQHKFLEAFVHTFKCVFMAYKLKPDILHIHAIGPSFFAPIARALGMKVVVTTHGPDYEREKWSFPAKVFLRFCERMGMTFTNEVIAIAKNIADDIRRKYGRESAVIANGVEIPILAETENILEKFLLKKKKYVLAVGRLVPEKGFHDLIEVFNSNTLKTYTLVIAGDADHEDKYSLDLKAKAGRSDNVVLTGFITGQSLQELYSHAALFVLPSFYEGLPIALLEAMSYGLPCIASDIPANKNVELAESNFFKAGDTKSIKETISVFVNKQWSEEDRKQQINTINQLYNWEKIADQTLEVYRKVD